MKFSKINFFILFFLCFSSCAFAADNYKFDPNHTAITWQVSHFGYSDLTGKFFAKGTLSFDEKQPQTSSVSIEINTANLTTGISKLDDTLKGKTFFDTSTFPTATFKSTKIKVTGKDTGKIDGILEIRGIAKPIELIVKLNKYGDHPFFHKKALGFTAHTTIKRSDFGMTGYIPGVSDETKIDIQAEAVIEK